MTGRPIVPQTEAAQKGGARDVTLVAADRQSIVIPKPVIKCRLVLCVPICYCPICEERERNLPAVRKGVLVGAYAVSVEKEIQFRGQSEMVTNIYHYRIVAPVASDYENLADAVVARDKAIYPSTAVYKWVRVWGPTEGNKEDSKMRFEKQLTGNGTRTSTATDFYPELCLVGSIFVGRSPVKNRKVFVRKYIRLLRPKDSTISQSNPVIIGTTDRTDFETWMNTLKTVTHNAVSFSMVTPKDVLVPSDSPAKSLPQLRIRQIKQ